MKTNFTLLLACLLFSTLSAQGFNAQWASSLDASFSDAAAFTIAPNGDIYVVGTFRDSLRYRNALVMTSNIANYPQGYLMRLDAAGDLIWHKTMVSTQRSWAKEVAWNPAGFPVVTGVFQGTIELEVDTFQNTSFENGFVAAYDTNGAVSWASHIQPSGEMYGLEVSPSGKTYLQFRTTGLSNPMGSIDTTTVNGSVITAAFDPAGNLLWHKGHDGLISGDFGGQTFVRDTDGNFIFANMFNGQIEILGDTILPLGTMSGGLPAFGDVILIKMDSLGNDLWKVHIYGKDGDEPKVLGVGADGSIYLHGGIGRDLVVVNGDSIPTSNSPVRNTFRFDPAGNLQWMKKLGEVERVREILLDGDKFLLSGAVNLNNAAVAVYDTSGINQNLITASGGGAACICDMKMTATGELLMSGAYSNTVQFGATTLSNLGVNDPNGYIAKINDPLLSVDRGLSGPPELVLYPNPTANAFRVRGGGAVHVVEIRVYDGVGNLVLHKSGTDLTDTSLGLSSAAGLYYVQVKLRDGAHVARVLVKR